MNLRRNTWICLPMKRIDGDSQNEVHFYKLINESKYNNNNRNDY